MSATATISARILFHVSQGMTINQAVDAVLGAGTYATFASDIYSTLRSEG